MLQNTIQITSLDMSRLFVMIDRLQKDGSVDSSSLHRLEEELASGEEIASAEVGSDVVTMNSVVVLRDLISGQQLECRLVFPDAANVSEQRISVLAPLGMAILGYRVGDTIEWQTPGGVRQYQILAITYQPEAAGDFHL